MLPLDVPFQSDPEYVEFLAANRDHVASVHVGLSSPALADARQRLEQRDLSEIISGLRKLEGVDGFALMNARLHAPEKYFDENCLTATATLLTRLADEAGIRGVIFADPYYLQALSDAHPAMAERLEAVPSINTTIGSADRAYAMIDLIRTTRFKLPSRLVLDRDLNRDMDRLTDTVSRLKKAYPAIQLHLIANEGCMHQCPYKPAHNAHIALVNESLCGERTFAMNRDLGCVRRLLDDPSAMLASPFIRPEDVDRYKGVADSIKLCGRNRGIPFLVRAVSAYVQGHYAGNLLDLMDAMGDLSDHVNIANDRLPADFLDKMTLCDKNCSACGWCGALAKEVITRRDPGLPRL